MKSFRSRRNILGAMLTLGCMQVAHASTTVIPFSVGSKEFPGVPNMPYVSVTLCTPGTTSCQTIPNILIDTGSNGLRIFSSEIKIGLRQRYASSTKPLAQCYKYVSASYWGSIKSADLILGSEKIPNAAIQVVDSKYGSLPADCANAIQNISTEGANGVLGISLDVNDKTSGASTGTKSYYSCSDHTCEPEEIALPEQLQNPIALLKDGANGYSISVPSVPKEGASQVSGLITVGIGTNAGNTPGKEVKLLPTDDRNYFYAELSGHLFRATIDSGTNIWNLPLGRNESITLCKDGYQPYLCPETAVSLNATLLDVSKTRKYPIAFSILNSKELLATRNTAFSNLGAEWGSTALSPISAHNLYLGFPFFYGRTIYFGFAGRKSSLGLGPFFAFEDYINKIN